MQGLWLPNTLSTLTCGSANFMTQVDNLYAFSISATDVGFGLPIEKSPHANRRDSAGQGIDDWFNGRRDELPILEV